MLTVAEIHKVLSLPSTADDTLISEWVIDSRRISHPAEAIFIALQGDLRDGHDFAPDAYQKGVRHFLVSRELHLPGDARQIIVEDVLDALQNLAAFNRQKYTGKLIGITGSNGKTIVKEWLSYALSAQYAVYRSPKSYNSQIGVALSLLEMDMDTDFAIIESGISQTDEMQKLQQMIQPELAVLTSIGDAHYEGFESVHHKLEEKLRLFSSSQIAYLGYIEDPQIRQHAIEKMRDYEVQTVHVVRDDFEYTSNPDGSQVRYRDFHYTLPFSDEAAVLNSLLLCEILHSPTFQTGQLNQLLQGLPEVSMRLEFLEGRNACKIINDVYSADLHSIKIALASLDQQSQKWKKSVILSELDVSDEKQKEAIAELITLLNRYSFYRLVLVGPCWQQYTQQLRADRIEVYPSRLELMENINFLDFQEEYILIKGARKFQLEEVVELLKLKKHSVRLEVDLTAMGDNLLHYKSQLDPNTKVMVMVKSQSYGTGYYEVAKYLQSRGVDYMTVTYTDEGVRLRQKGIVTPIMVMNPEQDGLMEALDWGLEPELYSHKILDETIALARNKNLTHLPIHIKLDTGMHRLGFADEDLDALVDKLKQNRFLEIKSIFTHLHAADIPDAQSRVKAQVQKFDAFVEKLNAAGISTGWQHVLNSAGVEYYPEYQKDMVRLGIGLYGVSPSGDASVRVVTRLVAEIAQIKQLQKGDYLGYGIQNKMDKDRRIATINVGYADGYMRAFGNGNAYVLINGKPAPTIANVCMDMCFVDISDMKDVHEGQEVILFGTKPTLEELALKAGTISYELITSISDRVPRVYNVE